MIHLKMYIHKLFATLLCLAVVSVGYSQDIDLDKLLQEEGPKTEPTEQSVILGTFKTTRIANGHSVETLPAGVFDLKIQHRFGYLSSGIKELFGLDQAMIRIGGDYGITDRFMVGLGRATYQKQIDGFLKYKLLAQNVKHKPLTVTLLAASMVRTDNYQSNLPYIPNFSDRFNYAFQVLAARKFSESVSLQIMPTLIHYNIVPVSSQKNDLVSVGAGGRFKLTPRTSFNVEYYYNLPQYKLPDTQNALTLGFDIETGGHVFQLVFTNGQGVAEIPFITETTGNFLKGDIHFGFNVSRVFQFSKNKK